MGVQAAIEQAVGITPEIAGAINASNSEAAQQIRALLVMQLTFAEPAGMALLKSAVQQFLPELKVCNRCGSTDGVTTRECCVDCGIIPLCRGCTEYHRRELTEAAENQSATKGGGI
jgi:hypothetical protein